jgi:predicted nuclease with RNAse H fold
MRALGVDVSERRGLDVVLLADDSPRPALVQGAVTPEGLTALLRQHAPDVVAIDSPPSWTKTGRSRLAERRLAALAIQSYRTPSEDRATAFHNWMKEGFRAFAAAAAAGYPRYGSGPVAGTAMEVFPHATTIALTGGLPPKGVAKAAWRRTVLERRGIETAVLRSPDLVDAAVAALTGLLALRSEFTAFGEPDEGVIVVPFREVPTGPYRRGQPAAEPAQMSLPRLRPCGCQDPRCRRTTSGEFAPGHDSWRKRILWERARAGEEALEELQRRGWEAPAELRGPRRR